MVGTIANEAINSGNSPQTKVDMGKERKLLQQFQISQSLTAAQKLELHALLIQKTKLFATTLSGIEWTDLVQHHISTGGNAPVRQHPRRLPQSLKKVVDVQIQGMLANKIISSSTNPWSSPVVLFQKKSGQSLFCVDYRKLNALTTKDSYPLPRIDETLDSLCGARYCSTLDLASGYWQVEVEPADRPKTAFTTSHGLYEFNAMPFGLTNAPSTFQRLMEAVLAGLTWEQCLIYLDDIVVFFATFEDHLSRLKTIQQVTSSKIKVATN